MSDADPLPLSAADPPAEAATHDGVAAPPQPQGLDDCVYTLLLIGRTHGDGQAQDGGKVERLEDRQGLIQQVVCTEGRIQRR